MTVLNQAAGAQLDVSVIQRAINDLQTQATSLSLGSVQVLAKSAVAVSCGADTTEDVLATIAIPAGALGPNGQVRVTTIWSMTNNANSKTPRIRFSGAGGAALGGGLVSASNADLIAYVQNRNASNSQFLYSAGNSAGGKLGYASTTTAVDTTAATSIVITGQKAVAGDALTLESYLVELMYGG